ncbi:MAG: hypothetical protein ACFFG0_13240 [Candidatus Thorarchaeota archaeon]
MTFLISSSRAGRYSSGISYAPSSTNIHNQKNFSDIFLNTSIVKVIATNTPLKHKK